MLCLATIVGLVVVFPAVGVGAELLGAVRQGARVSLAPLAIRPLVESLAYAIGIGVLATTIAWPVAWRMYDRSGRWLSLVLTPLIAPGYLAYTGLGLLRAPGSWLGDVILSSPGSWPVIADRVLAVVSLGLWTWPIACLAMCMALRRVDPWMWDALRLEPASWVRTFRMRLVAARGGVVTGLVFVALLMLGTAIPLHLARVGTYSVELWAELAATPPDEQWRVYVAAWPMIVVALVGAGVVLLRLDSLASRSAVDGPRRGRRARFAIPITGVLVSVGAPTALLLVDFDWGDWGPVRTFVRLYGDAIVDSATVSGIVLGAGLAIGLGVSLLEHCAVRRSISARVVVVCLLTTALVPGVLIGSAMLRGFVGWLSPILDWSGIVAVAHVARFGFIPALAAIWMARTTPPEIVAMQRLDGADTVWGWWKIGLPAAPILGAALVGAALSLHEIESAVMLAPPGSGSLARSMLEFLHFSRMQDLTIGALILLGAALAIGVVLVALGGFARPQANRQGRLPIP